MRDTVDIQHRAHDLMISRIKDDNFGSAVICCLVMVRRVHIWSSGCRHYDTNMDRLTITRQHMTAKLSSFIL